MSVTTVATTAVDSDLVCSPTFLFLISVDEVPNEN